MALSNLHNFGVLIKTKVIAKETLLQLQHEQNTFSLSLLENWLFNSQFIGQSQFII